MFKNGLLMKITSMVLIVLMIGMPVTLLAQQQDYMQGKMDGERDAKGNPVWVLAGLGCGVIGAGAAYMTKPSPPSTAILGKSTEYIMGYTEGYQNKARKQNAMYACGGWAAWVVIYLALISSASE